MSLREVGPAKQFTSWTAALDDIYSEVGGGAFTENHTVRGYGGTYEEVVRPNAGLSPTSDRRLTLEAAPGETVVIRGRKDGPPPQHRHYNFFIETDCTTLSGFRCESADSYGVYIDAAGVIIEDCEVETADDACVWLQNAADVQILRCSLHDSAKGIETYYASSGWKVKNNIIRTMSLNGINAGADSGGTSEIVNNTLYDIGTCGLRVVGYGTVLAHNNIIRKAVSHLVSLTTASGAVLRCRNNVFHKDGSGCLGEIDGAGKSLLSDWINGLPAGSFERNSREADPLLVDPVNGDFGLQAGSPCTGHGTNSKAPRDDFNGTPRIGRNHIGARHRIGGIKVLGNFYEGEPDARFEGGRALGNFVN